MDEYTANRRAMFALEMAIADRDRTATRGAVYEEAWRRVNTGYYDERVNGIPEREPTPALILPRDIPDPEIPEGPAEPLPLDPEDLQILAALEQELALAQEQALAQGQALVPEPGQVRASFLAAYDQRSANQEPPEPG